MHTNDSNKKPRQLSMKENALWNTAGSLCYQGCQWLLTVLVVKLSSDYTNAGFLAYAMTIGNIYSPIALYGMRVYQVSDVEGKYSQGNYVAFRFVTMAISTVFSIAYTLAITPSISLIVIVLVYLLFKSDETFSVVCYAADQKAYRMDYIGVSQVLRGILSLVGFSLGLLVSNRLEVAILCMFGLCLLVTLVYDLPHSARFGCNAPRISRAQSVALLRECLPAMISNVLCGMVVSLARQYFSITNGAEALGLYASVATPSVIVQLLASYLYNPAIAPIAEKWAAGDKREFLRFFRKVLRTMVGACLCAIVLLSLAGKSILVAFYGQSIADYTYLFPLVLVGTCLIAMLWFFMDILVVFRDFRDALVSNVISIVVAVSIMVPFISAQYMQGINLTIICALSAGLSYAIVMFMRQVSQHFAS